MFQHGPSSLAGPLSRDRTLWAKADPECTDNGSSVPRPFRADLVERIRREIAEGTYDTPEKWDAALDRLFKRLDSDDD